MIYKMHKVFSLNTLEHFSFKYHQEMKLCKEKIFDFVKPMCSFLQHNF